MRAFVILSACFFAIPVAIAAIVECWRTKTSVEFPARKESEHQESRAPDWALAPESKDQTATPLGQWIVTKVDCVSWLRLPIFEELGIQKAIEIEIGPCWISLTFEDDDKGNVKTPFPISLHPDKSPKRFVWWTCDGEEVASGIYKITESNLLVIALAIDDENRDANGNAKWKRPTRFDDDGNVVILCKLAEEAKER